MLSVTIKRPFASRPLVFISSVGLLAVREVWLGSPYLMLLFFATGFLVFINLYSVKYGAIALQEIFDSIQPK